MKKLLILALSCILIMVAIPGLATESNMKQIETKQGCDITVVPLTDGLTKASWGEEILTSKNPLGRKPYAFATESNMKQIETKQGCDITVVPLTDGLTKASWGEGILTSKNPLGRKPYAFATTKTFAGTAYKIKAKISVDNSDGTTNSSDWAVATNKESVESATIIAKTESCTFTGYHKIQDTSSSGWQSATTSKSY